MISRNPVRESESDQSVPTDAVTSVSSRPGLLNAFLFQLVNRLEKRIALGWQDERGFHFGIQSSPLY